MRGDEARDDAHSFAGGYVQAETFGDLGERGGSLDLADADGEGGPAALVVGEEVLDFSRFAGDDVVGHDALDLDFSQGDGGEDAGDGEAAEHQTEGKVEGVGAGVDGGDHDEERDAEEDDAGEGDFVAAR